MNAAIQAAMLVMCTMCPSPYDPPSETPPPPSSQTAPPAGAWKSEWTGTYYTWSLGRPGITLTVESSFVGVRSDGCVDAARCATSRDIAGYADRVLALAPNPTAHTECNGYLGDRIYFVRWGDRRYAVPDSQIADFVDQVRTTEGPIARVPDERPPGDEPGIDERKSETNVGPRFASVPVRGTDTLEPAFGQPDVPGEWSAFLHLAPIAARITLVTEVTPPAPDADPNSRCFDLTIDQGSDVHVFVGQELFWSGLLGHVVSVSSESAVVRFSVPTERVSGYSSAGRIPTTKDAVAALRPTSTQPGWLIDRD